MKSVLISIRPKWCHKIIDGKKKIEVRKTKPKLATPFKVYIYCSAGSYDWRKDPWTTAYRPQNSEITNMSQKVIGEFVCDKFYLIKNRGGSFSIAGEEQSVTNEIARQSCLDYDDMVSYFGNKDGYGWHISNLKIYDEPKELSDFYVHKYDSIDYCDGCVHHECPVTEYPCCECSKDERNRAYLYSPPQSWCYVEELQNV